MKQRKKNPVFILIFLAALAVFLFAAIKLGTFFFRYYKEDASYKKLEVFAALDDLPPENTESLFYFHNAIVVLLRYYIPIKDILSSQILIYFENMDINYPIVQGEDDDFYLHHDFYKEKSTSGCIFLDTEATPDFLCDNSFIYGHNMKNKSMFAKLNQYAEESFFQENKTFLIYTPTETRRYEIYSCYPAKLDWDSFTYQFENKEAYAKWQATVKRRSLYDTKVTPDSSQPTVTLMTCTPKGSNYRFLVHGRLMD
jgi:sortase B